MEQGRSQMYMLVFHVPEDHLESVKQAVFAAGAGSLNGYEQCCWQVLGTGQFVPAEGANPFLGSIGSKELVSEYRVETTVDEQHLKRVVEALISAHPYEVPSYHIIPVLTLEQIRVT